MSPFANPLVVSGITRQVLSMSYSQAIDAYRQATGAQGMVNPKEAMAWFQSQQATPPVQRPTMFQTPQIPFRD